MLKLLRFNQEREKPKVKNERSAHFLPWGFALGSFSPRHKTFTKGESFVRRFYLPIFEISGLGSVAILEKKIDFRTIRGKW